MGGMLRADCTQNYNFMECLKPEDIIQENESIPRFFFEYFVQENVTNLLDVALEKMCSFEYTETDDLGMYTFSTRNVSVQKDNVVF